MNQRLIGWFSIGAVTAALWLTGCAKREEQAATKASPSPSASPAAAGAQAAASGDLEIAKDYLDKASSELKNNNKRGAFEYLDLARGEITAAAANETGKSKTEIETAGKDLDAAKSLIEKNDKKAETSLEKVINKIDKLASLPKTSASASPAAATSPAAKSTRATTPAEKKP